MIELIICSQQAKNGDVCIDQELSVVPVPIAVLAIIIVAKITGEHALQLRSLTLHGAIVARKLGAAVTGLRGVIARREAVGSGARLGYDGGGP
jgi:hypothetical protein